MGVWSTSNNLITGRTYHTMFGTQSAAVTTCGQNTDSPAGITATETYDGTSWSAGTATTGKRYVAGCGTTTTGLICGGYTTVALLTALSYNSGTWSSEANMTRTRYQHSAIGSDVAALAIGGQSSGITETMDTFNGTVWSAGASMAAKRNAHSSCGSVSDALTISGGDFYGFTKSTETFNGTSWSAGPNVITERSYFGVSGVAGSAVIYGGNNGSRLVSSEMFDGTAWASDTNMPAKRFGHSGTGTYAQGLTCGGSDDVNTPTQTTYEFNSASQTSKTFTLTIGAGLDMGTEQPAVTAKSFTFTLTSLLARYENFNTTLLIENCRSVTLVNVGVTAESNTDGITVANSNVYIESAVVSEHNRAVASRGQAFIAVKALTGTGNTIGLYADTGSEIFKAGDIEITADVSEQITSGGYIH